MPPARRLRHSPELVGMELFADKEFVATLDNLAEPAGNRLVSFNPATGERLGDVPVAGPAEVEAAVLAAREAQPQWAALAGAERARILRKAAEILRARNDTLAGLETRDTGKPIQETRVVDVISGAECLEYFAALAQSAAGEHIDLGPAAFSYTRREALGVTAGIGAWNYPLQIACWKSAPALDRKSTRLNSSHSQISYAVFCLK